jgi:putative transcriptional regulator
MAVSASPLAPALLLAMPQMLDPNFARTVILLCEHGPEGAMGFVVNRPTEINAADAVYLDPPLEGDSGIHLWAGGPVEPHRGFLLLSSDPEVDDAEPVGDAFHITASLAVLRRLLEAGPGDEVARRSRLFLGYAGWGPGQLDGELEASAWLTAPADPAIVFETDPTHMWERAIRSLGVDPLALAPAPGLQ